MKQDWKSIPNYEQDHVKKNCQDHVKKNVFQEHVKKCLSRQCLSRPSLSRPYLSRPCLSTCFVNMYCQCQHVLSTYFVNVNMLCQCPHVLSMSTCFVYMFCQHALSTCYVNVNMFCQHASIFLHYEQNFHKPWSQTTTKVCLGLREQSSQSKIEFKSVSDQTSLDMT